LKSYLALLLATGLAACSQTNLPAYPLMDGKCAEYANLPVTREAITDQTVLNIYQDPHYVWVCVEIPPDSFGMVEVRLNTPNLDAEHLLHVSAQLGEWPYGNEDAAPKHANSDKWWNHDGWYSNAVAFNGMEDNADGQRQVKFKTAQARELQISKDHFGRGTWKMIFDIRGLNDPDLENSAIMLPEQSTADGTESVYYELDVN